MIKHIVFFRLLGEADGQDKSANIKRLCEALEALPPLIPEILALEVGENFNDSPAAFDVSLYTEFDDADALNRYQVHPEHQKVVQIVQHIASDRAVVDYSAS